MKTIVGELEPRVGKDRRTFMRVLAAILQAQGYGLEVELHRDTYTYRLLAVDGKGLWP